MPFQSEAQHRWARANKPEMARKWTNEMRGGKKASKHQKEHPIKHANLPERVKKSDGYGQVVSRGVRVTGDDIAKGTFTVPAAHVARGGAAGRKQLRAAALQAESSQFLNAKPRRLGLSQQARLPVTKGMFRQSVKPTIARVKPNRSARRIVHAPNEIIGKSEVEVAKFGIGRLKQAGGIARSGWKAGGAQRGGAMGAAAKPRMSLGQSVAAAKSPTMGRISTASQWAGRNPAAAGGIAGAGVTGGILAGNGQRNRNGGGMYPSPYGGFGKRSYDPEAERRFRQGAYATGAGVAGAGLGVSAVRDMRRAGQGVEALRQVPKVRAGQSPRRKTAGSNGRPLNRSAQAAADRGHAADMQRFHALGRIEQAQGKLGKLPKRTLLITPKSGAKALAGLGLLGGSGALLKERHEERWD